MEGDRDDAHVGALAMRPGMVVGILHHGALDLVADVIHPLDAVAVLGGVEAHLADGLLALPVLIHGIKKLVPGQLLRVVNEVLDGRQGIDAGREASEPVDTGSIQRPRYVIGVCVEVGAIAIVAVGVGVGEGVNIRSPKTVISVTIIVTAPPI